tara:strand:+ start:2740 stop:3363 length:624 start_codon:yes stop_codon:yes gene_type:complete
MAKLIFFGKPMAGKGTFSKLVSKETGIVHISTGDLFRKEMADETELGKSIKDKMDKGELISDDITVELLKKNLPESFILDGFPRTLNQAEMFKEISDIDLVVDIDVSDETVIERTLARRICRKCGAIYGLNIKPNQEGVCDKCGGELYQRDDDNEKTIKDRLEVYNNQTKPLLDFYKDKLVRIDGNRTVDPILQDILKTLKEKSLYM